MSKSRCFTWLADVTWFLAVTGWLTPAANAQPAATAWPTQGQNVRQTGQSPVSDGCLTGNLKWVSGASTSGVVLGPDAIYCFTDGSGLTAVNYDGSLRWRLGIGGYQSPAIAQDGTIYFGNNDGFYAVDPNGPGTWIDSNCYLVNGIKWQKSVSGWIQDSAVIDADGSVLVGTLSGVLYRFNPDGSLRWSLATGGRNSYALGTTPSLGPDGTIYVGSETPALLAITPDGKLKWKLTTASHVHGGPAVAPDGVLYCSDSQGMLYAVNAATGVKRWSVPITQGKPKNAFTCCSPSIDPATSTVYCGGQESLYAYGFDGRLKWRQPAAGRSWSQPALGVSGIVFSHSHWLNTMSAFAQRNAPLVGQCRLGQFLESSCHRRRRHRLRGRRRSVRIPGRRGPHPRDNLRPAIHARSDAACRGSAGHFSRVASPPRGHAHSPNRLLRGSRWQRPTRRG